MVSAGSASPGDDFSVAASVVGFAAGETRKSVSLAAVDDVVVEGDETVVLGFGALAPGFSAGSTDVSTVTIADGDAAVLEFTAGTGEVSEGSETGLELAIVNGVTFAADQVIDLAVSGSAVVGDDFVLSDSGGLALSAPFVLTLAAGDSSVEASLRAVDDAVAEGAETVGLQATLAGGGSVVGSLTVTIPASDLEPSEVTIAESGSVFEGSDAVFEVWRGDSPVTPLSQELTVRVKVTGTGGILDGAPPSSVMFAAGDDIAVLRVGTVDDLVVEDTATVTAQVVADAADPPGYLAGSPNVASVGVLSDDQASFGVTAEAAEVLEGDTVTVTVDTGGVTFAQPQPLTVDVAGTATPMDDFVVTDAAGVVLSAPYRLVLPAGVGSVSLGVAAAADAVEDDGETVQLLVRHDGSFVGTVTVTLVDPNERPVIAGASGFAFPENGSGEVATFTATDAEGDTIDWSLGGDDAALFSIAGGVLEFGVPPDYEMPTDAGTDNVYEVTVLASDGGGAAGHEVIVTVADVDEAATITSSTGSFVAGFDENAVGAVASFAAADPEGAVIRWSLGGVDSDDFEISSGGVLSFLRAPDFEGPADVDGDNEYVVEVRARAGAGVPVAETVRVKVANVDEPGVVRLSPAQPQAGTALTAALSDPDGVAEAAGAQSWRWRRLVGGDWVVIGGASAPGYEPVAGDVGHVLGVDVVYRDRFDPGVDSAAAAQAAHATRAAPDTNRAPAFGHGPVERTVAENSAAGSPVGAAVAAVDPDPDDNAKLAYSLSGPDMGLFSVDGASGLIRVGSGTVLDYEAAGSYSVTVTAADPSGASDDIAVAIKVTDVNEAPAAAADIAVTAEDARVVIAVLDNDSDPDNDALTAVEVRDAPLHGRVTVLADKTLLYVPDPDFFGDDIFTYAVSDGRLSSGEATVTVTVNPINDQPKFAAASVTRTVVDGAPAGSPVGAPVTADDIDDDPLAYALFDVDASLFAIDAVTGQITVAQDTVIDRSAQPSYRLRVQATDRYGARVSTYVNVTVTAARTSTSGSGSGGGGGGSSEASTAVIIVANGWSPADIGVAAALSARTPGSAVIYTAGDRLSTAARDLLSDYLPAGVIVVGGKAAVSDTALASTRHASESESVERITGATRSHTAAAVARRILDAAEPGAATLIIANGWSPADIGAAAALSARTPRSAVAYTATGTLPEATQRLLRDHQPARVLIIGGETAIGPAAETAIRAAAPTAAIERISGATRTATAARVARRFLGPHQPAATDELTVIVANGWSPPDIGVAAALSARTPGSAVLYTETNRLTPEAAQVLRDYQPTRLIFIGGPAAITAEAKEQTRTIVPDATAPRYSGATRTHTAAAVARRTLPTP